MPGDSKASNNEVASSVNQTDSATLTITMRTVPLPEEWIGGFWKNKGGL